MPLNGNLATRFTFQVTYTDPSNAPPPAVTLVLDDTNSLVMAPVQTTNSPAQGQVFRWQGTLSKARHQFHFAATNAVGDLTNHWDPLVSDQPLTFRNRFFYFPELSASGDIVPVGDVNGDGYPDLIHTRGGSSTPILLFGPNYDWGEGVVLNLPAGTSAATVRGLGDIDGDGCADFAFSCDPNPTFDPVVVSHVIVYRGQPNGHPVLWKHFTGETLPSASSPRQVLRGVDLDQDGHPDLVTSGSSPRHSGYLTTVVISRFGPDLTRMQSTDLGAGPETGLIRQISPPLPMT
jgi:hypothetical protein